MKKTQILKHVSRLKKVSSKKAYLVKCINQMDEEYKHMQSLRHYPNPVYNGKPVTYDRLEEWFLDMCDLKDVVDSLGEPVYSIDTITDKELDNLPF